MMNWGMRDIASAIQWFERAAEQGDLPSQKAVAYLYRTQRNDLEKAAYWLYRAAAQRDWHAQVDSCLAFYSRKTPRYEDYRNAYKWCYIALKYPEGFVRYPDKKMVLQLDVLPNKLSFDLKGGLQGIKWASGMQLSDDEKEALEKEVTPYQVPLI